MGKGRFSGGLPFEKGERPKPLRPQGPDEAFIRQKITEFLDNRNVVYFVTDAKTVATVDGPRQLVWPEGCSDIIAQ